MIKIKDNLVNKEIEKVLNEYEEHQSTCPRCTTPVYKAEDEVECEIASMIYDQYRVLKIRSEL